MVERELCTWIRELRHQVERKLPFHMQSLWEYMSLQTLWEGKLEKFKSIFSK